MNLVVMGFQMQICLILYFSWSILIKFCVYLQMGSSKTQMLLLEKNMFHKYWLFFAINLSCLHLTFVAFVLSVICKQGYNVTTMSTNQRSWSDSGQIVRHQNGLPVDEVQNHGEMSHARSEEKRHFGRLRFLWLQTNCNLKAREINPHKI